MSKRKPLSLRFNPDREERPDMLALIDGDLLCYRIGFTTEKDDEWVALTRLDHYIDNILFGSGCSDYVIYLTDSRGNFRNTLYPEYKTNRKQPKPRHFNRIREALLTYEGAIFSEGQEADDALGIHQTGSSERVFEYGEWLTDFQTVICSIDKDLLQVPGPHYNFVNGKHTFIDEFTGKKNFYRQILTGDPVDNIPGLPKIGPVKANKYLEGCLTDEDFQSTIIKAYKERLPELSIDEVLERVTTIGRLLWVRREEGQHWSLDPIFWDSD